MKNETNSCGFTLNRVVLVSLRHVSGLYAQSLVSVDCLYLGLEAWGFLMVISSIRAS